MISDLAIVRQLEAVSFRAWPAASVHYDGSWLIRQTASHPSKRLNSVNPLDPSDHQDIEKRIESAERRFQSYNRPLVFRLTPLASPKLESYLDARGWIRFGDSIVMMANIADIKLDDAIDMLPVSDPGRYVDASIKVHQRDGSYKAGLTEVLGAIKPKNSFFIIEDEDFGAVSCVLCVRDNAFAGVLDAATHEEFQRLGHATSILKSAVLWAKYNDAEKVWLQVEKNNAPAQALYKSVGFEEIYQYSYRQEPDHSRK